MSGKTCRQEMRLLAYLDGELSGNELKEMEAHLADCSNCSDTFKSMIAGLDALRECMPEAMPPERVKQQLFRRIRAVPEIRRRAGIPAWAGIGRIFPLRSRAWIAAFASIMIFAVLISAFQYHRRLEDNKILAQIDRSRAVWVARGLSINPFDIEAAEGKLRAVRENPFQSFLSER